MKAIIIDGQFEYTIKESKNKLSLFYSFADHWSEHTKGAEAFSVKIKGEDIVIPRQTLDASEECQLRILLNYRNRQELKSLGRDEKIQIANLKDF